MSQHLSAPLNAYGSDVEAPLRFRGSLTDQAAELAAELSDGSWEDEDTLEDHPISADQRRLSSPASASTTSTRQTPKRKRRRPYLASNRRNDYTEAFLSEKPPLSRKERFIFPSADVLLDGAKDISILIIRYFWDISSRAFHHSRFMLGILLALWAIAVITIQISPTLWGAVSPICYIPLISSSNPCVAWRSTLPGKKAPAGKKAPRWADYPKMIDLQSKTFQQLMDESIGGSALSLEVKKAEMAITDLVSFVHLSKLKAKDTLATSLVQFVLDAKKTGRGLQKLSSKIGGAVDK